MIKCKAGKRNCIICKDRFEKDINKPWINWCSDVCALVIVKRKTEKQKSAAKTRANKEWAEKKKSIKENLMTHGDYLKLLEKEVNAIARRIDFSLPCISCGGYGKPQAGHYHSVGSDATLRFNLHNIHQQDYFCNVQRSANIPGYDEGLIKIYGQKYWEYVKFGLKNIYFEPLKLSIPEIKEMVIKARKIKESIELEENLNPAERILIRDEINNSIGIYKTKFN